MNRRHFLTAMGSSVALLLSQNREILARLQYLSTPEPAQKPDFESSGYSNEELLYLGTLFTWLALLDESLGSMSAGIDAMQKDAESDSAIAQVLVPLGVWIHIEADTLKVTPPNQFDATHEDAVQVFSHLASAAKILTQGVLAGSATALTLSTEHILLATEHVTSLLDSLPFTRPNRSDPFT